MTKDGTWYMGRKENGLSCLMLGPYYKVASESFRTQAGFPFGVNFSAIQALKPSICALKKPPNQKPKSQKLRSRDLFAREVC